MHGEPGTKFSQWLVARGISSEALATGVRYSVPAVNAWRAGRRRPQRGAIALIALFCKAEVAEIESLFNRRKKRYATRAVPI